MPSLFSKLYPDPCPTKESIGKNFFQRRSNFLLFGKTDSTVWSVALVDYLSWWHLDIEKCLLLASSYRWTPARHLANMCSWLISRWEFGEWVNLVYWKWRTHGVVPSETRMPWVVLLCAVCCTLFTVSLLRGTSQQSPEIGERFLVPLSQRSKTYRVTHLSKSTQPSQSWT